MATLTRAANAHVAVTTGWTNPSNAFATTTDGVFATGSPARNATVNGDFGFPDFTAAELPDGTTINSVTLTFSEGMSAAVTGGTKGGQLFNNGVALGTETTSTATTQETLTQVVTTGITVADLRSASSLIKGRIRVSKGATNTAMTGNLDFVSLTVDYTAPPPVVDGNDGAWENASFIQTPVLVIGALAASLAMSAVQQTLSVGPANEDAPTFSTGADSSGLYYTGNPKSTLLDTGVRYFFSGDEITAPVGGGGPIVHDDIDAWVRPLRWSKPLYPQPWGFSNEEIPQQSTGADASGLLYFPTPDSSVYRSGVRYSFAGDEAPIYVPPSTVTAIEDYWNDPQRDVEGEAVTIPLPFSWEEQDTVPTAITGLPDSQDFTLLVPPKPAKVRYPQPWSFPADEIRILPVVDESPGPVLPLAWASPVYPQPWSGHAEEIVQPPVIHPLPDDDGDLVRPKPWAQPVYPQPWSWTNTERLIPPVGASPNGPLSITLLPSHATITLDSSTMKVTLATSIIKIPLQE